MDFKIFQVSFGRADARKAMKIIENHRKTLRKSRSGAWCRLALKCTRQVTRPLLLSSTSKYTETPGRRAKRSLTPLRIASNHLDLGYIAYIAYMYHLKIVCINIYNMYIYIFISHKRYVFVHVYMSTSIHISHKKSLAAMTSLYSSRLTVMAFLTWICGTTMPPPSSTIFS